ncbi:MAG: outer membrane lipoprotein-sorting protein [Spirochaetia bacterium]
MRKETVLFVLMITIAAAAFGITGQEIIDNADNAMYPENFRAVMTLTTEGPARRDRSMTIQTFYKQDTGTFMEIQEPPRSRGTRFLQRNEALWMYNPRSGSRRAIRLSARDSFQGSLFSNNDIGDPNYADDYTTELLGTESYTHEELGEIEVYRVEGRANSEEVPYSHIIMLITTDDFIPLYIEYYARSGTLFKRMRFSGIQQIAGRRRPTVFTLRSEEAQDTYSRLTIEELEERNNLPDSMFNQNRLTR